MTNHTTTLSGSTLSGQVKSQERVLRNTYWLLALSMLPTVAGAGLGLSLGLSGLFSGLTGALMFFAVAFGFMFAIEKTKHSFVGVGLLLAFTFVMGLMLSSLLGAVLGRSNGAELIMTAFAGTAAVFVGMASLSSIIKRDLSGMGKFLFIGMILLIVASLANLLLQSSALMITLSVVAVGIFSAFILHDLKAVRDGHETNYIIATLGIYLSLYNVFSNLLSLLGIFGSDD